MQFTPGPLTSEGARQLNELVRVANAFSRLTVAAPLSLTRPAGIPAIRLDGSGLGGGAQAAQVVSSTGSPPVHTVKLVTRNSSNAVTDQSPSIQYTQVLNLRDVSTAIANGTKIEVFPIEGYPDWYWADYTAVATASITVKEQDGTPSYSGMTTVQFDQADGFVVTNPSGTTAQIDLSSASTSQKGAVDTTTQSFAGNKTFTGNVIVSTGTLDVGGVGTFESDVRVCDTSGSLFIGNGTVSTVNASETITEFKTDNVSAVSGADGNIDCVYRFAVKFSTTTHMITQAASFASSVATLDFSYTNGLGATDLWLNIYGYKVNNTSGVSGSFTTTDGKTVTVTRGIVTSIV